MHSDTKTETTRAHPKSSMDTTALVLGIASVFLGGSFGIVPLSTLGLSIYALTGIPKPREGIWKSWVGLTLGILYTLVYLANYGYL